MEKQEKVNFWKQHADTITIIGVNIGIAAFMLSICLSNMSSILLANSRLDAANSRLDAANARMDTLHVMFYDLLKEVKK